MFVEQQGNYEEEESMEGGSDVRFFGCMENEIWDSFW